MPSQKLLERGLLGIMVLYMGGCLTTMYRANNETMTKPADPSAHTVRLPVTTHDSTRRDTAAIAVNRPQ